MKINSCNRIKFYAHHKKKKKSVYKVENSPECSWKGENVGDPHTGGRIKTVDEITSHVWYQFWVTRDARDL